MSNVKQMVTGVFTDVIKHWNRPAKGNRVSYKEIFNFGIGGMGQQCVTFLLGYLGLSAGNTLLGSTLGLRPMHLQYMAMVQTVLSIFFTIIRGKIVDNTRTKWGRFRPYIAIMGFPLVIMGTVFIFLPFETMSYTQIMGAAFAFAIATSMVSPFFTDTYNELATVITPSSEERAKVMSIQSLLYSFAPTIIYLIVPLLSNYTGGYTDIRTYRYIVVPLALAGVGLNLFTAFGCKERVVTSQSYVQKVGIVEGVREIFKNKYWWIRNVAGWIGFLEGASGSLFLWIYMYAQQDMTTYALLTTVVGTASGIAMIITPWLLKKLGNRKLLLGHNAMNIVFVSLMTFTFKLPLLFVVLVYLNTLINALSIVYNQVMHSEVKDYQQYLSGKRMDFMFGTAGLIGIPIGLVTGLVIPFIYECMGLTTNYDILYDPAVRNQMFYVLCLLSILGASLNLIPWAFYSMSRERHRNIVKVLEYRAVFDDYENDCLTPDMIKRTVDGVREAYAIAAAPVPDKKALKAALKEAKASGGKEAVKEAKQALKAAKLLAEQKQEVTILMKEINKYDDPEQQRLVRQAEELKALGLERLKAIDASVLEKAKALPHGTKEEKKVRRADVKRAKKLIRMAAAIQKNYKHGIVAPEEARLQTAIAMPQGTGAEKKARNAAIKAAEKELSLYHKTLRPYLDAVKLTRHSKLSRTVYAEVESRYEDACAQLLEEEEHEQAKAAAAAQNKEG